MGYFHRDEPYFEDLGRRAKRFELDIYFVGGAADLQADLFDKLLWQGQAGPLVLPRLRRERVKPQTWNYDADVNRANWRTCRVVFVEAGQNQYPAPQTSWPHALLEAALEARTAFADALAEALELVDLGQEVLEDIIVGVVGLGVVLGVAAALAAGELPATALASAALLATGFVAGVGLAIEAVAFASATVTLLGAWTDALAGPADDRGMVDRSGRLRTIEALWHVYENSAAEPWPDPGELTVTETAMVTNRGAFGAGVRRTVLAEISRQAASLVFVSYNEAAALRERLADAFDAEIDIAGDPAAPGGRNDGARVALQDLRSAALQAISAAGADKAKLVPYEVPRPRPALALAQLFYGDADDVPGRAAELAARIGAIHPAFLPARGERLSK